MNLNRAELRKVMYDFNSISNRLLQANFQDYTSVVSKFVKFIKKTPIIHTYIIDCGACDQDMTQVFVEMESYERRIFYLGDEQEEEVRNVFAILNYIAENNIQIHYDIAMRYSSSNKYQDRVKEFNNRVVMVLIRHIESYLTKIGIDMGSDEKITYSITVHDGQVNIAGNGASITATNSIGVDATHLAELLQSIRDAAVGLSQEDTKTLDNSLKIVEEEIKSNKPRKSSLNAAISSLKTLNGTIQFTNAIIALSNFLQHPS